MLIGLTGAIGGGKSTALSVFSSCGARVSDADRMCHELYGEDAVLEKLSARWGDILGADGRADRQKIASIVFQNQAELDFLTGILYPELEKKMALIRQEAALPGKPVFIVEIPLLFESGWEKYCDATVALWTGSALRHMRLRGRGMSPDQIAAREARQWSEVRKLEAAGYGLINTGSKTLLEMQCKQLLNIWEDHKK